MFCVYDLVTIYFERNAIGKQTDFACQTHLLDARYEVHLWQCHLMSSENVSIQQLLRFYFYAFIFPINRFLNKLAVTFLLSLHSQAVKYWAVGSQLDANKLSQLILFSVSLSYILKLKTLLECVFKIRKVTNFSSEVTNWAKIDWFEQRFWIRTTLEFKSVRGRCTWYQTPSAYYR